MRRMLSGIGVAGVLVAAGVALAACSSGGANGGANGSAGGSAGSGRAAYGAPAAQPSAAANDAVKGDATTPDVSTSGGTGSAPALLPEQRIRTAEFGISVRGAGDVGRRADAADAIARRLGGDVDSDDRTGGTHPTADLRLLVPPGRLDEAITQLARLGHVDTRQVSSQVVTQQVADVNSRVTSAQDAIDRLDLLYKQAARVPDVLAVESVLSQREADLESLLAQQHALSQQTTKAAITLHLSVAVVPPAKHHGFLGGLARGWDAFVAAVSATVTAFGTALPFLVVLLVVALALRLAWPRLRRRTPAPAPSE